MASSKEPPRKKDDAQGAQSGRANGQSGRSLEDIGAELEAARREVRALRDEFDAVALELSEANEELQAINEEYRSAAGGLKDSNEELRSINDELRRVNSGLKARLGAATQADSGMQSMLAAAGVGILVLDGTLHIERVTPWITALFGIEAAGKGCAAAELGGKLNYPAFGGDAEAVLAGRKVIEREIHGNGACYLARLQPCKTGGGEMDGVACTFVDITARAKTEDALKAGEARLRLLLSELSHRVKNTLAVVQSMARQSFRGNVSREEGLEVFSARLRAFAEAHNLLVSSDWRGADFRELAERQLNPYARAGGKTIALKGPAVSMPPDLATPFALVLHELATNALKYGALSSPAGTLRLEWDIVQDGPEPLFRFTWREAGGPKAGPSSKEGFGSWLIQNGLPDAQVALEYPEGGATCTITMPAANLGAV
jgi:two-component system, chemotaxis family, CheB/CheR fusion protein